MRAIGYCRVSTEEQALEGVSLAGQAERIQQLAALREVGPVEIIEDGGWSGKNLERPGMQGLLERLEAGEVAHLFVWKLDRLTRSQRDFQRLLELFGTHGVNVHSVTESVDLSSAAGRMQANILGAINQYGREHIVENVTMGMQQAMSQGRHVNRAKYGYRMVEGSLIPDPVAAPVVELIFRRRAEGDSLRTIADATGVNYGTVRTILYSRVYLGEIPNHGGWLPGIHEPILDEELWQSAQRRHEPGRRHSRHLLAGRVRCGLCGRSATVKDNGDGRPLLFRCWHRGTGCRQPARSARGLERAAVFGLRVLRDDSELREAIRRTLARDPEGDRGGRRRETALRALERDRQKLLDAFYAGAVSDTLLGQEERRFSGQIQALRSEQADVEQERASRTEMRSSAEAVFKVLEPLDIEAIWKEASEPERRVLVDELLDGVAFFPDHLEVSVRGTPAMNVLLEEVGLTALGGDRSCRRGDLNPHEL